MYYGIYVFIYVNQHHLGLMEEAFSELRMETDVRDVNFRFRVQYKPGLKKNLSFVEMRGGGGVVAHRL